MSQATFTTHSKARSTGRTADLAEQIVAILREEGEAQVLSVNIEAFATTMEAVTGVAIGYQLMATDPRGVGCYRLWIAAEVVERDELEEPTTTTMDNARITIEWLEGIGFKDLTSGWGGSTGNSYLMHLTRGSIDFALGTVDFTSNWVLCERYAKGWKHIYPVVMFTSRDELNQWTVERFGEPLFS